MAPLRAEWIARRRFYYDLMRRAWREFWRPLKPGAFWSVALPALVAAWLLVEACWNWRPALGFLSFLLSAWVFQVGFGGWRLALACTPALLIAALCSPPFLKLLSDVAPLCYDLTNRAACITLSFLAIPNDISRAGLEITGGRLIPLPLDRAGSGLFLAVCIASINLVVRRRPGMFLPFLAVFAMVVLLVLGALGLVCFALVPSVSEFCSPGSPVCEAVRFVALFLAGILIPDALMARRTLPDWKKNPPPERRAKPLLAEIEMGLFAKLAAVFLLAMGMLQIFKVASFIAFPAKSSTPPDWFAEGAAFGPPIVCPGWTAGPGIQPSLRSDVPPRPRSTLVWTFLRGDETATLLLDHFWSPSDDLSLAYLADGWITRSLDPSRISLRSSDGTALTVFHAHIPLTPHRSVDGETSLESFLSKALRLWKPQNPEPRDLLLRLVVPTPPRGDEACLHFSEHLFREALQIVQTKAQSPGGDSRPPH
jgi:hypothetical protein